ncbi:hypothetical protein MIND_00067800 [Mycena indigotica]|uniref:Uncharacterized protein n=1 Tax=Mycena indigotica TaxID=2126181 RepID=A0A8H6TDL7_9AGAR|nr:uncharacterized protein MIND_00067800 [Mycena indigotica]KAF7315525.1 hypothetical protein MIND_00067800 [Mycena indigotica]
MSFVSIPVPDKLKPSPTKKRKKGCREPTIEEDADEVASGSESSEDESLEAHTMSFDDPEDAKSFYNAYRPRSSDEPDLWIFTAKDLSIMETLDRKLQKRPVSIREDLAGYYPGISSTMKLKLDYMSQHPEVSACGDAQTRIALVGENDDEQAIDHEEFESLDAAIVVDVPL